MPAENHNRQVRVFISRTTKGLRGIAEKVASVLRSRGMEPVIQTEFLPHWASVRHMLQDRLKDCDAVICLIGPAHGGEPEDPITGLRDPRTEGKRFSFTQIEFLVARDLPRPVFTFVVSGADIVEPFETEAPELAARQQQFIKDYAKDTRTLFYDYTDATKLLEEIGKMDIPRTALAGKPANLPYASLGTLFKGRDEFLDQLRTQLTSEAAAIIKGHRTIHGMGGVGKTRAAIEYAWRNAEKYSALLFVSADSAESLQRNLAALCGPLVLNLPEQKEKDQNLQVEAALKWLQLHPGWFLIIDNVDTADAAEETKALLQRLSAGHVVITSRLSDWSDQVTALDLDVLSDAASIEFLNERTAERRSKQPDDDATVARLVRVLDCLALALEQAGALISHERLSYARYLEMWEFARPTALAWHDEEKMKYPRSLAVTYETSVAQLSNAAKEFFRELSWLAPDPLPRNTLDALPDPADARRHLSELDHLHLVRFQQDGKSFTVHRLVQEITRQKQGTSLAPPPLVTALKWVDGLFVGDGQDVRTWPVLDQLASHAQAVASFADGHAITDPTSQLMSAVGVLLTAKAQHRTAEIFMRRALAIDDQSVGTMHPYVARDLNNLAALLMVTNRMAEAEPMMHLAVSIDLQTYGPMHSALGRDFNNLAQLLQNTNRLAQAEPLLRRVLAIAEQSGSGDSEVAMPLCNLARLLYDTNRLAEAEPLLRRAIPIFERSYGITHPHLATALNNLAQLLQDTNRLEEAESLMRRALDIDEKAYGPDHPAVAENLNSLAGLLYVTKRMAEAERLLRRALVIHERRYGPEHPNVALQLHNLAQVLKATNRLAEAEPLIRQTVVIILRFFSVTGHEHPNTGKFLHSYVRLYQAMQVPPEEFLLRLGGMFANEKISREKMNEILAAAFAQPPA